MSKEVMWAFSFPNKDRDEIKISYLLHMKGIFTLRIIIVKLPFTIPRYYLNYSSNQHSFKLLKSH